MSAVDEFCSITGTSKGEAQQYIEMANGDLERAVDLFFSGAKPAKRAAPAPRPAQPGPQRGVPAPRPAQPQKSNNDLIKDIIHLS